VEVGARLAITKTGTFIGRANSNTSSCLGIGTIAGEHEHLLGYLYPVYYISRGLLVFLGLA
jgi:hypothetical protein